MYKVLLVDDEYMVTEGLKRLIPFDKWDMGYGGRRNSQSCR